MKLFGTVAVIVTIAATGCGASDSEVELEALTARDLLGLAPRVARDWDATDRQMARDLVDGAAADALQTERAPLGVAPDPATAVLGSVSDIDDRRSRAGLDVIPFATAIAADRELALAPLRPRDADGSLSLVPVGWEDSAAELLDRDPGALASLAVGAGHPPGETLFVSPATREPFAALYLPERRQLLVNPIYLAALEPVEVASARPGPAGGTALAPAEGGGVTRASGNPYTFFGSIGECAAAERLRCESCVGTGTCEPVTRDQPDGDAECETLAADNGRGYYLLCANLSAAMATVAQCIDDDAPGCPVNEDAGNRLAALEANAALIDDPVCLQATDDCLTKIFGPPDQDYPPPPDPADPPPPPPPPPREVEIDCGENSANCDFSPQFGCSSESCTASPSCGGCEGGCEGGGCDSGCGGSDSSCDSGSCEGGGCESCDSNGGCETGSCSGCESDGSGGGSSGCGGGDSSGGGGCEGSSCDGGSSGGCSGGGDCGGGGGSCGGGDCGGSGGSSSCTIAAQRSEPPPAKQCSRRRSMNPWALAMLWGVLPLAVIGRMRQRERARRRNGEEGQR